MTDYMNIPSNPMTNLPQQIREHWAHYRPKMFAEMEAKGVLDAAIERAAQMTEDAVFSYSSNPPEGMSPAQAFWAAWEMYRNEWAFLPAEEGFDEEDENDPEYQAYRERMQIIREMMTAVTTDEDEDWDEDYIDGDET